MIKNKRQQPGCGEVKRGKGGQIHYNRRRLGRRINKEQKRGKKTTRKVVLK